jgi:prophage tail gpP-like protein
VSDDQVEIFVSAGKLIGWKSVEVVRTIESVASGFSLTMSELELDDPARRILRRGDDVEVRIAGVPMLKGYIWKLAPSYSPSDHSIAVTGWDVTADLQKCSNKAPLHVPARLEMIVADICKPFGISVSVDVDTGAVFHSFTPEVGASADSIIDKLVRYRGVIRVSDGVGGLLITLPGSEPATTSLSTGDNILTGSAVYDDSERFQEITLEAQRDVGWGGVDEGASIVAVATDPNMNAERYLPLVDIPTDPPDGKIALQALAQREINLRAGRSQRVTYTVRGWRHNGDDGPLWNPGELVTIADPWLAVSQVMLLTTASFSFAKNKRKTKLSFMIPEAFDLREVKQAPEAGLGAWATQDSQL